MAIWAERERETTGETPEENPARSVTSSTVLEGGGVVCIARKTPSHLLSADPYGRVLGLASAAMADGEGRRSRSNRGERRSRRPPTQTASPAAGLEAEEAGVEALQMAEYRSASSSRPPSTKEEQN